MASSSRQKQRVHMQLPEGVVEELAEYAELTGRTKTEFVRMAIGVLTILCDEIAKGRRVFVMEKDGSTKAQELILPR